MSDEVGSAWNRTVQIDVVGMNTMEKTLILGECKWTLEAVSRKVIAELVEEKAARIVPEQGSWRFYFVGFSCSGWSRGALAYKKEIEQRPPVGKNWVCVGLRLLELNQVDENLAAWSL